MNNFFKDKKNIIIILLTIFIIILITMLFLIINKNDDSKNSIDASNMSYNELVSMFEKNGYNFELLNIDNCVYIILKNPKNGITIQRVPNTLIGTLMTFADDTINNEMADLIDTSENNNKEKQQQYKAYQNWLNNYNISKLQLCSMLDNYYEENKDKIEYINTNDLLNNN
jgi:hypothetical protein